MAAAAAATYVPADPSLVSLKAVPPPDGLVPLAQKTVPLHELPEKATKGVPLCCSR